MQFLYTIGIRIYAFLLRLAARFHIKAKQWVLGRKNVFETLQDALSDNTNEVVWIHVSSLGEFEQGRPLIAQLKEKYPSYKIVLTFFSPSGYEIRKDYPLVDVVVYLPIDTPRNAKRFFDIVKPCKVFFVKYDFWYHYLHEAHNRGIPTYLIAALFRKEQLFFRWYGGFYRKILHFFTAIFTQDDNSAALLSSIGYKETIVCGDTRVDRVATLAEQTQPVLHIEDFKKAKLLLIAGSTWQPDEDLLIRFLKEHNDLSLKMIIAPHEVHRAHIQELIKKVNDRGLSAICYSALSEQKTVPDCDILFIDSIGLLSALYQYGDMAYIGGGFGAGIHNTLEPAAFGLPIIFGEKYQKFNEAVCLVDQKGAFSIKNYEELEKKIEKLVKNTNFRKEAGSVAKTFVFKQKGATDTIVSYCFSVNC